MMLTPLTRQIARALAIAVLASTVGCSVSETLDAPSCTSGTSGASSVLISAQSVPTASLVACFDPPPTGWEVDEVRIGDEGTIVVFESDRAGARAATFRYEESCDTGEATATPTEFASTTRHEWILQVAPRFRANRYYRFDGGCVTWEFDFDPDAPAAMAIELGNTLQFVERDDLNADVRRVFVDEDL